jgi:hypothetical protein
MPPMEAVVFETVQQIKKIDEDEGLSIRTLIDGLALEKALANHEVDFRDRSFPPDLTLMAFCTQLLSAKRFVVKLLRE